MLAKQTHLSVAITMFSNMQLLFFSPFPIFWSFSLQFYIKKYMVCVWLSKKLTKMFTDSEILDSNFVYTIQ